MKEYIVSLEKEFLLIENSLKEEEKDPLEITNLMIMSIVKKYQSLIIKLIIIGLIIYRLGMSNLTIIEYIIFFLLAYDFFSNRNKN